MKEPDVIVVGAGLAGLVAAHELVKVGRRVLIVEQENRTTGKALSVTYTPAEQCDLEESGLARRSSRLPSRGKSHANPALASALDNLVPRAVPCIHSGLIPLRSTHLDPW